MTSEGERQCREGVILGGVGKELRSHVLKNQFHAYLIIIHYHLIGFPGSLNGKASAHNGRPRFDPWSGKIPWEGNDDPLPVLTPGNPMDRRAWVGRVGYDWVTSLLLSFNYCSYHDWSYKVRGNTEENANELGVKIILLRGEPPRGQEMSATIEE